MKRKVFIGSSSEGLHIAEEAKIYLENYFDVSIWKDGGVFKSNESYLASLQLASLHYDYAILIGTPDDQTNFRGKEVTKPRDNIIFELGLFLGRLGKSKCQLLLQRNAELASDFDGITVYKFDSDDSSSLEKALSQIKDVFIESSDSQINMFPSSTLASVYFKNFVDPICRSIARSDIKINQKEFTDSLLYIIKPDRIVSDMNIYAEKNYKSIKSTEESIAYDGRTRKVQAVIDNQKNKVYFYDYPTILSGIEHAISSLLPDIVTMKDQYMVILKRELHCFFSTLEELIDRADYKEYVRVTSIDQQAETLPSNTSEKE